MKSGGLPSLGVRQGRVEHVSSSCTPAPVRADTKHTGHEMPFAQCLLERRVQLLGLDLALLEIEGHGRFVDLDDLVDQAVPWAASTEEKSDSPAALIEAVDHALAAVGGQVDRQHFVAERGAELRSSSACGSMLSASILLTMITRHSLRSVAHSSCAR